MTVTMIFLNINIFSYYNYKKVIFNPYFTRVLAIKTMKKLRLLLILSLVFIVGACRESNVEEQGIEEKLKEELETVEKEVEEAGKKIKKEAERFGKNLDRETESLQKDIKETVEKLEKKVKDDNILYYLQLSRFPRQTLGATSQSFPGDSFDLRKNAKLK